MTRSLQGRRVLITGASSGVGCAAAEAFAREGCRLALLARNRDGLETVAERVRAEGAEAHVVVCDVGDRAQVERAVEEAATALGGLDVLISNAASMAFGHFRDVSPEEFDRTIAVTFTGAVDVIRAALPHLERSGGAIVATGSIMARVPLATFSSYAAAKHGLRGFLNSLRIELAGSRSPVTVSIVHPGAIDTPLWHQVTSATGRQVRNPPEQYKPQVMAQALVALAKKPRKEVLVGYEAKVIAFGFEAVRPVADLVLRVVDKWYSSGKRPAPRPGGLWEGQGRGRCDGGLLGRPSLYAALRLRHGRTTGE